MGPRAVPVTCDVLSRSEACSHPTANISDDMHPLAAASRSRLLETEPKLFVLETSYHSVDDIALNLSLRKSKC